MNEIFTYYFQLIGHSYHKLIDSWKRRIGLDTGGSAPVVDHMGLVAERAPTTTLPEIPDKLKGRMRIAAIDRYFVAQVRNTEHAQWKCLDKSSGHTWNYSPTTAKWVCHSSKKAAQALLDDWAKMHPDNLREV